MWLTRRTGAGIMAGPLAGLVLVLCAPAAAQGLKPPKQAASEEAASVLILVNDTVRPGEGTGRTGASVWVGEYYAAKRGIPRENILHLQIPNTEDPLEWDAWHTSWEKLETSVRQPLKRFLSQRRMAERIRYIVPVYGIPSHTHAAPGIGQRDLSVDSFLSSLDSEQTGVRLANPYRAQAEEAKTRFREWRNPAGWRMYLVTRLDGPTPAIAAALADKAVRAERTLRRGDGTGYYDFRGLACCDGYYRGDLTVSNAHRLSVANGFRSVLNDQREAKGMIQSAPDTLWAWGWYSGPATNDAYRFVEGAVGAQLTSYTAEGIRVPRKGAWVPVWLQAGITATWGATAEPTVAGYAMGDNLLNHLWMGYNFGESAYLASPWLNHTMVFVGDPLYAPQVFRRR